MKWINCNTNCTVWNFFYSWVEISTCVRTVLWLLALTITNNITYDEVPIIWFYGSTTCYIFVDIVCANISQFFLTSGDILKNYDTTTINIKYLNVIKCCNSSSYKPISPFDLKCEAMLSSTCPAGNLYVLFACLFGLIMDSWWAVNWLFNIYLLYIQTKYCN